MFLSIAFSFLALAFGILSLTTARKLPTLLGFACLLVAVFIR